GGTINDHSVCRGIRKISSNVSPRLTGIRSLPHVRDVEIHDRDVGSLATRVPTIDGNAGNGKRGWIDSATSLGPVSSSPGCNCAYPQLTTSGNERSEAIRPGINHVGEIVGILRPTGC